MATPRNFEFRGRKHRPGPDFPGDNNGGAGKRAGAGGGQSPVRQSKAEPPGHKGAREADESGSQLEGLALPIPQPNRGLSLYR
jgi:hypothetical protein